MMGRLSVAGQDQDRTDWLAGLKVGDPVRLVTPGGEGRFAGVESLRDRRIWIIWAMGDDGRFGHSAISVSSFDGGDEKSGYRIEPADVLRSVFEDADAMKAGDRAEKIGGSYQARGEIRAVFTTRSGLRRAVFEFDSPPGLLHIFNPDQLAVVGKEEKRPIP